MCTNLNAGLLEQIQAAYSVALAASNDDVTISNLTFLPGVVLINGTHPVKTFQEGWLTDYVVQGCRVKLSVKKEGEKNAN